MVVSPIALARRKGIGVVNKQKLPEGAGALGIRLRLKFKSWGTNPALDLGSWNYQSQSNT